MYILKHKRTFLLKIIISIKMQFFNKDVSKNTILANIPVVFIIFKMTFIILTIIMKLQSPDCNSYNCKKLQVKEKCHII